MPASLYAMPLKVGARRTDTVVDAQGAWIATCGDAATARRFVSCVNACDGIDTDDLEKGKTWDSVETELTVKRDALHLVVSVLAAKAEISTEKLLEMLAHAEGGVRAKRWLS
jgi:hypothetical protein